MSRGRSLPAVRSGAIRLTVLCLRLVALAGALAGCGGEAGPGDGASTADAGSPIDLAEAPALEAFVRARLAQARVPAVAVAVVKDGRVAYQSAFGLADVDAARPAAIDTVFPVGALAGLITSIAALQQVEAGELTLDQPVAPKLPFALGNPHLAAVPVTLASLLTGTSGILDRGAVLAARTLAGDAPAPIEELLGAYLVDGGADYAPLNFLASGPGTAYAPSTVALTLAADLVQVTSRAGFDARASTAIFTPLGMTGATFLPGELPASARARGYARKDGGGWAVVPALAEPTWPATDLHASVASMARLLAALARRGELAGVRVLADASVALLEAPQVPALDAGRTLGLLVRDATYGRVAAAGSTGIDHGATLELRLADRVGVIVMTNAAWDDAGAIQAIVARLFDDAARL